VFADSNPNPIGNVYSNANSYRHCHGYSYGHIYAHSYADTNADVHSAANPNSYAVSHSECYVYPDANCYSDRNVHANPDSHRNINPDPNPAKYSTSARESKDSGSSIMKTLLAIITLFITITANGVTLVWDANDPAEMVNQYKLYRLHSGVFTVVKTIVPPAHSVLLDPYLSGRTTFYVTAVNSSGESLPSVQKTVHK
jgi:hypothetical protein